MKQRGCSRLQDSGNAQQDQASVKSYNNSIVIVDTLHQRITDMLQNYDTFQIIRTNSDVCDLSCNLGAFAYCNTCVSCRKGRGIVKMCIRDSDNPLPSGTKYCSTVP